MTDKELQEQEQKELTTLEHNSPMTLPDNPTQAGWTSSQIKKKMSNGLFYLYSLIKGERDNCSKEFNNAKTQIDTINKTITENKTEIETKIQAKADIFYVNGISSTKVDKKQGYGLSKNDFTDELLAKLNSLNNYDDEYIKNQINDIKRILTSNDVDFDTLQELVNALKNNTSNIGDIFERLSNKVNKSELKSLAYKDSLNKNDVGLGNVDNTSDLNKPISTLVQKALDLKANKTDIPTKLSDLKIDIEIGGSVDENRIVNLITNTTYTQNQIDNKISAIPKFDIQPVNTLPSTDISSTTVYLLKTDNSDTDLYEEYIYVEGNWELLGTAKVDLSNYIDLSSTQTITGDKTFQNGIKIGNASINFDSSNRINICYGNQPRIKVGNGETLVASKLSPDLNNAYDLGRSGLQWKDLYLSGKITDGTNGITLDDLLRTLPFYEVTQGIEDTIEEITTKTNSKLCLVRFSGQTSGIFLLQSKYLGGIYNVFGAEMTSLRTINTYIEGAVRFLSLFDQLLYPSYFDELKNYVDETVDGVGINEEQVLDIIEENSEETSEISIGTSDNYDVTSDEQIPTSKAVATMIANNNSDSGTTSGNIKKQIVNTQVVGGNWFYNTSDKYYKYYDIYTDFTIDFDKNTQYFEEFSGEIIADENDVNVAFPEGIRWKVDNNVTVNNNTLTFTSNFTYLYNIADNVGIVISIENEELKTPSAAILGTRLSWDEVKNATSYDIYSNEVLLLNTTETTVDLSQYITEYGEYSIWVIAKSNKYKDSAQAILPYIKSVKLATPSDLVLNDEGVLTWSPVEYVNVYKVYGYDSNSTQHLLWSGKDNYVDLSSITFGNGGAALDGTYQITVRADGDGTGVYLTSDESAEIIEYTWEASE